MDEPRITYRQRDKGWQCDIDNGVTGHHGIGATKEEALARAIEQIERWRLWEESEDEAARHEAEMRAIEAGERPDVYTVQ